MLQTNQYKYEITYQLAHNIINVCQNPKVSERSRNYILGTYFIQCPTYMNNNEKTLILTI